MPIAIVALLAAVLALPAAAHAVKPTASLEFEVPNEGRVGYSHLVFTVKKKTKELSKRAGKRLSKGSKKLSKKVRAKAKLKGGKGIPEDVQVVGSVARLAGAKRAYALDVVSLHAGPGAQPLGSRPQRPAAASGEITSAQGWDVTLIASDPGLRGTYTLYKPKQVPANADADADVTAEDPSRGAACGPDGDLSNYAKSLASVLSGDLIGKQQARDALTLGGFFFCDIESPRQYDYLFDLLGLDRPQSESFNCTGVRIGDNTPFGHTFTGGTCNQPIVDIRFEITKPPGGTYFDFNAPFPSCQFANGQRQVHCTSPPSANKTKIQGSAFGTSQPTECIRVTAMNSNGNRYQAITDTSAFATCP